MDKTTTIIIKSEDNYLSLVYFLIEHNIKFDTMVITDEKIKEINYYHVDINER